MIITIDGPAGAGKSSAARLLAVRLGIQFLDTGAMYRSVALATLRAGIDRTDQDALAALMKNVLLHIEPGHIILNGENVTAAIRTAEVTQATGAVADSPVVRQRLAAIQREIAADKSIVCEGRDQGTVVFPDAGCKFFLIADPRERARRRRLEMAQRGERVELDSLLQAIEVRDRRDATRGLAPMVPAADAIVLDSTGLTLEQVVDRMEAEVRRRMG